jgi:membrane protein
VSNLPKVIQDIIDRTDRWLHKKLSFIVLPGFNGMPLYDVLSFFFHGLFKGVITYRAAAIAFNFFLAIVPFILFLFTLIPIVTAENIQADLLEMMENIIPEEIHDILENTIVEIVSRPSTGLLSLVFVLAIYFATNGIDAILDGFGQSYHEVELWPWWRQKVQALLMMTAISLLITVAMILLAFGKLTITVLSDNNLLSGNVTVFFLRTLQWMIIVLSILTSISMLYYFGQPKDREQNQYRFFSPGSILATSLFVVGGTLIKMYFENFARYNLLYGSVGSIIILLVWLYYNSIIILIGFELNASIIRSKAEKTKTTYRIIE